MARLLVVSRSMALAMRIADDHDVVEYPVEALEDLAPAPDVEAVVLDLGEPHAAMQTLDRLRSRGFDTRVMIVSGYQPAWNDLVALSIQRVEVVPLPITRAALLDGIDRLLGVTPFVPRVPPAPPPRPVAAAPAPAAPLSPPVASPAASPAAALPAKPEGDGTALPVRPVRGGQRPPATPDATPDATPEPAPADAPAPAVPAAGPVAPGGPAGVDADATGAAVSGAALDGGPTEAKRRPGLARWLTTTPPRPTFAVPPGSPLDAGAATRRSGPAAPAGTGEPDLFRPVVDPQVPARSAAALPGRNGAARRAPPAARATLAPPAPLPPAAPTPSPAPAAAPADAPAPSRHTPPKETRPERGSRGRRRDPRDQHPGFTPAAGLEAPPSAAVPVDRVHGWVRALLDRRSELFGVAETAQVLADEVIERGEADAAAVLVPDGPRWRVSGGVGLRPLERRLLLDTSHWLISEIAVAGRALLIEDTDIVRPRLAGAPLAAWRHLLAVPVPSIRAAVVLARGQEAARFTEQDLAAVVPIVTEAGPLLQAALQMRELARALGPLRDLEG